MSVRQPADRLSRVGGSSSEPSDDGGEPAAITDQLSIERVSIPNAASPGSSVSVQVTVQCHASPFTVCEGVMRVTTPSEEIRVPTGGTRDIPESATETFNAQLTMEQGDMPVTVEVLDAGDVSGSLNVEASAQRTVQAASPAEALALNWGPWAIGGGAAGVGAAYVAGYDPVLGLGAGAGVGVGARALSQQAPNIDLPDVNTTDLVLGSILLLGGLVVVDQVSDRDIPGASSLRRIGSDAAGAARRTLS